MTVHSEFYPPRARWPSFRSKRVRRRWWRAKTFLLESDALGCSLADAILSFLIPAYAFKVFRHRRIALALAIAYVAAAAAYVYWVGYYASALMVMISVHVSSAGYLCKRVLVGLRFSLRLMTAFAIFLFLYGLVYRPLNAKMGEMVIPLRVGKNIVLINRLISPATIQRGDLIAYQIRAGYSGEHNAALAVQSGFGFSQALAVPGDTIRFFPKQIEINGRKQRAQSYMPMNGELRLAKNEWFVWPELATGGNRVPGFEQISAAFLERAVISEKDIVGKPCERWFWKQQKLP
jgi:hypothetical protein